MLENTTAIRKQTVDYQFRTPDELTISQNAVKRILVIGSCMAEGMFHWAHRILIGAQVDHILYNYPTNVIEPPHPIEEYDFQLIHMPLRVVVPEVMLADLPHESEVPFIEKFKECEQRLIATFEGAMAFSKGAKITTFVSEFLTPQQNPMGRLLPRYDFRNPTYFVEQINKTLHQLAAAHGAHMVQTNAIASTFGRKFIQEDFLHIWSHAGYAADWDIHQDTNRIQLPVKLTELYPMNTADFILAFWCELNAMYRTIVQQDSIKLVIVDLDDTLWRGVIAEEGIHNRILLEGWPLGIIEALKCLKHRGILLAIASKNDEAKIMDLWPQFLKNRLELEDFVVRKINWRTKVENIHDILAETNLLPRNVLFIDDNPVERESVRSAFPEIRVLGEELYSIRRMLLWSPETQVPYITQESSRRTEMMQAQVQRGITKAAMPAGDFLASLDVAVGFHTIKSVDDERFPRALELINKSNQFNTTGKRWSVNECHQAFNAGMIFETFEVQDKYSSYGLVGIALLQGSLIEQFVMSCRVLGLGVEAAVLSKLSREHAVLKGVYMQTEANVLCRDLYEKCAFDFDGGFWLQTGDPIPCPPHITFM